MTTESSVAIERVADVGRLGKAPAKSSTKALLFDDFLKRAAEQEPPASYNFWKGRAPFPSRTFGNTEHGCCTIASQAVAALRAERIEQRRTIDFSTDEILRVYYDMTQRLYGGGDTGAYETDALSNWRRPELTFRDSKGRPYTIDAYTRVNHLDHAAVRRALWITAAKGIKVCFNLPWAWASSTDKGQMWDLPEGQQLTGDWIPGTWGGHSMFSVSKYNAFGFELVHTWDPTRPSDTEWRQVVTWQGAAAYMDEVHWYVDSVNSWKKTPTAKLINFDKLVSAVNEVSEQKIKLV